MESNRFLSGGSESIIKPPIIEARNAVSMGEILNNRTLINTLTSGVAKIGYTLKSHESFLDCEDI